MSLQRLQLLTWAVERHDSSRSQGNWTSNACAWILLVIILSTQVSSIQWRICISHKSIYNFGSPVSKLTWDYGFPPPCSFDLARGFKFCSHYHSENIPRCILCNLLFNGHVSTSYLPLKNKLSELTNLTTGTLYAKQSNPGGVYWFRWDQTQGHDLPANPSPPKLKLNSRNPVPVGALNQQCSPIPVGLWTLIREWSPNAKAWLEGRTTITRRGVFIPDVPPLHR